MTLFERLDPRTLLFTVSAIVSLGIFANGGCIKELALALVFAALLAAAGRYKNTVFWLVLLAAAHGLAFWASAAGSEMTARFAWLFAMIFRKLFFVVSSGMVLVSSVSVGDCIKGLEKMRAPWSFVVPTAICFRFLPAIAYEGRMIRDALRLRGLYSFSRVLLHPLQTGELFMATLLFRTMSMGEELAFSVSTRAASGRSRKAWYREKTFGPADILFAFVVIGTAAAIVFAPWEAALPSAAFANGGPL